MLNAFELDSGRLRQVHVETLEDLRKCRPVWVDFDEPTETEIAWASEVFGINLPDGEEEDEVEDIEASARFYIEENGEIHVRSDFFLLHQEESEVVLVSFVLKDQILFSLHTEDLPAFRLLRLRARIGAQARQLRGPHITKVARRH